MYEQFCKQFAALTSKPVMPWPLDPDACSAFIHYLAEDVEYAFGSIEDVIVPSLKRLHLEKTQQKEVPPAVCDQIRQALHSAKNKCKHLLSGSGRQAAIIDDVIHIIKCMPKGHEYKAEEASILLWAVSTGARAVTCTNVLLQDVKRAFLLPNGLWAVSVAYTCTKGNSHWDQVVTLEGNLSKESPQDPVFWLQQHLQHKWALSLSDHAKWNLSKELQEEKLWHWNAVAMSAMFKERAQLAGFPEGLLSFHSLRAGFICSALIKAGSDADAQAAVLENTAFVAGWVPHGKAQLRYVQTSVRATIIANRMIRQVDGSSSSQVIELALATSAAFHGLPEDSLQSKWNPDRWYDKFMHNVNNTILAVS